MQQPLLQKRSHIFLIAACLLLSLLLTACNTGKTDAKTIKIKPTPTPAPLVTYQGDGYMIGYPQGWSAKGKGTLVTFTDVRELTAFIIEETPNPNGAIPPAMAVTGGLNGLKGQSINFQKIATAPTLMLGGNTWDQGQATADTGASGETTNLKLVVLSSDYPQHTNATRTFTLIYSTLSTEFERTDTQKFQPMLQSFKFA